MIVKQKWADLNSLALDLNKPEEFEVSITMFYCDTFMMSVDIGNKDEQLRFTQTNKHVNFLAVNDLDEAYEWLQSMSDKYAKDS